MKSAYLALFTTAFASLTIPPPIPASFPTIDQTVMISGNFLTVPLVADALAHVVSVVSPAILAIPPSKFVSGATTTYDATAAEANCYWPANLCTRSSDTADYKADITVCPNDNDWGVTYDDGPTVDAAGKAGTAELLTALKDANVKATFFMVGSNAMQFPSVLNDAHTAGHQIAAHTWTHHPLTALSNAQIVAEFKYTEAVIFQATGVVPVYFRPPYGDIDDRVRAIATALGYRTVVWTTTPDRDSADADTTDLSAASSSKLLATVETWFTPQKGFISLEHDISTFTTALGIQILAAVKAAGATFPLKPQAIGTCEGLTPAQWYSYPAAVNVTANTTTTSTTASYTSIVPTMTETLTSYTPPQASQVKATSGAGGFVSSIAMFFAGAFALLV
jgi:peptidoglycan/xylan/chitin deacetylase (PgdA/CDA1 family)